MDCDKKIQRKIKRFAARLKSTKGIACVDYPKINVVLCNVGQATGLLKDMVLDWIKMYCPEVNTPKFIAEKGETHSFLVFKNIDEANIFYSKCNGLIKIDNKGTPLYLNFVNEVPNNEVQCDYEDPTGLSLFNDFISIEEETEFIKLFDWVESVDCGTLKNRQVKHYGYEFRYGTNDVDLNTPLSDKIPEQCAIVCSRLRKFGIDLPEPDQLTVNKYIIGQGIPSHVDRHSPFGSTILSLSLGSSVVMDWKHHSGKYVPVVVPARSLLVMQSEARYDWQHGIQPRTWDPVIEIRANNDSAEKVKVITNDTVTRGTRISLTFRWTRAGPCECSFKTLCDSVSSTDNEDIEDKLASNLENIHVHQVYEQIAGHFSTTRFKPWPRVVDFLQHVAPGSVVVDLGCGNGKNVLPRNDVMQLAGERSAGLLSECKSHMSGGPAGAADCVRLDLLCSPLRDGCADYVICIAVIHHFSSKARRLQAISTISRLLRPGGRALITVWAKDQTKSNYLCKTKQQKQTEESHLTVGGLNLPVHENRTQFQHNDVLVPWKLRSIKDKKMSDQSVDTLLRFYHVFEDGELATLCEESPAIKVESIFYDEGNWCAICKKI